MGQTHPRFGAALDAVDAGQVRDSAIRAGVGSDGRLIAGVDGVVYARLQSLSGARPQVDADPLTPSFSAAASVVAQPQNGSSTTSPLVAACGDYALVELYRLLSGVAYPFGRVTLNDALVDYIGLNLELSVKVK